MLEFVSSRKRCVQSSHEWTDRRVATWNVWALVIPIRSLRDDTSQLAVLEFVSLTRYVRTQGVPAFLHTE